VARLPSAGVLTWEGLGSADCESTLSCEQTHISHITSRMCMWRLRIVPAAGCDSTRLPRGRDGAAHCHRRPRSHASGSAGTRSSSYGCTLPNYGFTRERNEKEIGGECARTGTRGTEASERTSAEWYTVYHHSLPTSPRRHLAPSHHLPAINPLGRQRWPCARNGEKLMQ
jgi:hypothetical protein